MAKKEKTKEELQSEKDRVMEIEETNKGIAAYKPDGDEDALRQNVYQRKDDMEQSEDRLDSETDWDNADKAYRAYTEALDDDDYRTNINKPIAFSTIETELQETLDRNSRPHVKPREHSDENKTELINDTMDYSFDIGNFDYQFYLAKKESLVRGTGVLMEYYRTDKRVVKMPDFKKVDGKYEENYKEEEKTDFDDVYSEYVPLEMIYVDPAANHIEKARDAIYREILHIDEFRRKYSTKTGFKNIEYVSFGGDTDTFAYYNPPKDMNEGEEVEVLHYYNRAIDEYTVVCNDVVIRTGPIPFPHKELPFVFLYCYKLPNKFYGFGIPKIVEDLTEERNTISNLRIDAQKMQLNKMFLYDDAVELDDYDLVARPHGGIPVNTQGRSIRDVIQYIEYSDIKPSGFREEEIILEDIRRTTGVDDRLTGVNMGGTATEAAILKESSMKRINAKARLWEIDSLVRLGRMRLENVRYFYPIPKIERIVKENGDVAESKKYRSISVKGRTYRMDEDNNLVAENIDGYSFFEINNKTKKLLDGEYDIEINAEAQTPLSKPLQQAKVTEMFNLLTQNPALMGMLDPRKAVHRYLRVFDEDPESWLTKDYEKDYDMELLADIENEVMSGGQAMAPTPGATEEHTMIHLNFTKTAKYQNLSEQLRFIFENHIEGETAGMGASEAAPNMGSQAPAPGINPIDLAPNMGGGEERPQQEAGL